MFKKLKNKLEEVKQAPLLGLSPVSSPQKTTLKSGENDEPLIDLSLSSESTLSSLGNSSSIEGNSHSSNETQVPILNLEVSYPLSSSSSPSLEKNIVFSPFTNVSPHEESSSQRSFTSSTCESPLFPSLNLSARHYNLISDLESEAEEPPIGNLDAYSKEDIYLSFRKVERRLSKYRTKYTELVAAYRENEKEKDKIKVVLTQTQDKALRRITELREQSQLDLKAKQHLEENFRMSLEEKDELIGVLNTKIQLLKESGGDSDSLNSSSSKEDSSTDITFFKDKNKRLEILLNKCKETIKNNKERSLQLHSEIEQLKKELEVKKKEELKDLPSVLVTELQFELENVKNQLQILDQDGAMALAETKREMHEELERKEQIVKELRENLSDLKKVKHELEINVNSLNVKLQQSEEQRTIAIEEMQLQLEKAEAVLEEEKSNLIQELSRGKAATILLLQQETEKRISEITQTHETALEKKDSEIAEKVEELQNELQVQLDKQKDEYEAALRSKELELSQRMAEKENQMMLAIEERELQKMATVAALDTKKDELQLTVDSLMTKQVSLDQTIEEMKQLHSNEIRSWTSQIENNSKLHKTTIEELNIKHKEQCEKLESQHQTELELKVAALRQEFEIDLEKLKNLHQEEIIACQEEQHKLSVVKAEKLQLTYEAKIEDLNKRFEQTLLSANTDVTSNFRMQLDSVRAEHQAVLLEKNSKIDEYMATITDITSQNEKLKIIVSEIQSIKLDLENTQKDKDNLIHKFTELKSELDTSQALLNLKCSSLQEDNEHLNSLINEKETEGQKIIAELQATIKVKDEYYSNKIQKILESKEEQDCKINEEFNLKLATANELISNHEKRIQDFQNRELELCSLLEKTKIENEKVILELNIALESSHNQALNDISQLQIMKEENINLIQNLTEKIASKAHEVDSLTQQLSALQCDWDELKNKLSIREQEISEMQNNKKKFEDCTNELKELHVKEKEELKDLHVKEKEQLKDLHMKEIEKMQNTIDTLNIKVEELNKNLLQSEKYHEETQNKFKKELENTEKLKEKFEERKKKVKENIEKMKQNFHSKLAEKEDEFKKKLELSTQKNLQNEDVISNLETFKNEELDKLKEIHQKEINETNERWEGKIENYQSEHKSRIIELTLEFETKWKESIEQQQKELVSLKNAKQELEMKMKSVDQLQSLIEERENQIKSLQQELELKISEYMMLDQNFNSISVRMELLQIENDNNLKQIESLQENLNEKMSELSQAQVELEIKVGELKALENLVNSEQQNKTEEWLVQVKKLNEMCHEFEEQAVLLEDKYEVEKSERQILEKENKYLKEEFNLTKKILYDAQLEITNLNCKLQSLEVIQTEVQRIQDILNQRDQEIDNLTVENKQLLNIKADFEEKLALVDSNKSQLETDLYKCTNKYKSEISIFQEKIKNLQDEKSALETSLHHELEYWQERYNTSITDYEEKIESQKVAFEEQINIFKKQIESLDDQSKLSSHELENRLQAQLQESYNKLQLTLEFHKKELENIDNKWKLKMKEQKDLFENLDAVKIKEFELAVQGLEEKYQEELKMNQKLNEKNNSLEKIIAEHEENIDQLTKATSHLEQVLIHSKIDFKQNEYLQHEAEELHKEEEQVQRSVNYQDNEVNNLRKRLVTLAQDLGRVIQNNTLKYEEEAQNYQKQLQETSIQIQEMKTLIDEKEKEKSAFLKNTEQKQIVKLGELKKKAETKLVQIKRQLHEEKEQMLSEYRGTINDLKNQLTIQEKTNSTQIAELQQKFESELLKHNLELEKLREQNVTYIEQIPVKYTDENIQKMADKELQSSKLHKMKMNHNDIEDIRTQLELLERENIKLKHMLENNSQVQTSNELIVQNEIVKKEYEIKIENMEKEHNSKIKKLVRELTSEMARKEKEAQEAYQEIIEKNIHLEEQMNHEHRIELKELHQELAEKNTRIDELLEEQDERFKEKEIESKAKLKEYENKINFLETHQIEITTDHQKELRVLEQKLKSALRLKLQEKEVLHQNEIEDLLKEWELERKHDSKYTMLSPHFESQELVTQNDLALNVVDSGKESSELLRKQIMAYTREIEGLKTKHRLEIAELKHHLERIHDGSSCPLLENSDANIQNKFCQDSGFSVNVERLQNIVSKLGSDSWSAKCHSPNQPTGPLLTEPTEMEYLKNILYEYMMGRETLTMAKVIAAVMKFPEDQTRKILEKEEARTAFTKLGFS